MGIFQKVGKGFFTAYNKQLYNITGKLYSIRVLSVLYFGQ